MYVGELMPPSLPDMRSRVVGVSTYGRHVRCSATTERGTSGGGGGPLRSWVRTAFGTTVSGLPTTFWWLWVGTLVNRAGAFVLPFLAFYLTDELDLTPSFVGLVLGALRPGQRGRQPGRRRPVGPAGAAPGPARQSAQHRCHPRRPRCHHLAGRRRAPGGAARTHQQHRAAGVLRDDHRHRGAGGPGPRVLAELLGDQPRLRDRPCARRTARESRLPHAVPRRRRDDARVRRPRVPQGAGVPTGGRRRRGRAAGLDRRRLRDRVFLVVVG